MKVHSNFTGPKSKKSLIAFSCATALASFAFIARPAFAEEAKVDNSSNLDTTAVHLPCCTPIVGGAQGFCCFIL